MSGAELTEVRDNEVLFLEDIVWEIDDVELVRVLFNERHHATGVILRDKDTGQMVDVTFKPHGTIEYRGD